jgi:hypothetical protein
MPPFKDAISPSEIWAAAYRVWYWIPQEHRERDTPETLANWSMP